MHKYLFDIHQPREDSDPGEQRFSWQLHTIKGDATNYTATKSLKAEAGRFPKPMCVVFVGWVSQAKDGTNNTVIV